MPWSTQPNEKYLQNTWIEVCSTISSNVLLATQKCKTTLNSYTESNSLTEYFPRDWDYSTTNTPFLGFFALTQDILWRQSQTDLSSHFNAPPVRDSDAKWRIRLLSQVSGKQLLSPAKTVRLLRAWTTIFGHCCVKQSTFPHRSPLFSLVTDYRNNHSNSLSRKQIVEGI